MLVCPKEKAEMQIVTDDEKVLEFEEPDLQNSGSNLAKPCICEAYTVWEDSFSVLLCGLFSS